MTGRPQRLAVVMAQGSVTESEVILGLEQLGELVFVVRPGTYADQYSELFRAAGTVVHLGSDGTANASALRDVGVDAILTFSERMLSVTAELAAALDLMYHSPTTVRLLTDKFLQRSRLRECGVDGPGSVLIRDASEWDGIVARFGLPLVVKPVRGEGSRHTHLIRSRDAGRALVAELLSTDDPVAGHGFVVEEYLVGLPSAPFGDYVSVESASIGGTVRHIGVTGKFPLLSPFRETGQFHPAALPAPMLDEARALAERALCALDVRHGITHTEIKITAAGPRLIEVNGRIGGYIAALYHQATGDLVELAGRLALGEDVEIAEQTGDTVAFQYYHQPPAGATSLLDVEGARELRRFPGITGYRQFVKPSTTLPTDGRSFDLDLVSGRARSFEEMLSTLDGGLGLISFSFSSPGGPVRLTGHQLRRQDTDSPWPQSD